MTQPNEANRREASRYAVNDGVLECKLPGSLFSRGTKFPGEIVDLSVTGCKFHASEGLPLRTKMDLTFTLPDSTEPMTVKGSVRKNQTVEVDGKFIYEIGIEFEPLKDRDLILLRHRLRSGRVGERVSERRDPNAP